MTKFTTRKNPEIKLKTGIYKKTKRKNPLQKKPWGIKIFSTARNIYSEKLSLEKKKKQKKSDQFPHSGFQYGILV